MTNCRRCTRATKVAGTIDVGWRSAAADLAEAFRPRPGGHGCRCRSWKTIDIEHDRARAGGCIGAAAPAFLVEEVVELPSVSDAGGVAVEAG